MTDILIQDICRVISLQLGLKNIQDQSRIVEDLGAESADVANIIAAVESKYNIRFKESEIARIYTPADLFNAVMQHVSP
jgi:acyl carrier protein